LGGTSGIEIQLRLELEHVFGEVSDGAIRLSDGRKLSCDIAFHERRVVVEYDGNKWHEGAQQISFDKAKTRSLEADGWTVVRVRERPLEPLSSRDISVPSGTTANSVCQAVVPAIAKLMPARLPLDDYSALVRPLTYHQAQEEILRRRVPKKLRR
jgi:hypothetical protein